MKYICFLKVLLLAIFLSSCVTKPPVSQGVGGDYKARWDGKHQDAKIWTQFIVDNVFKIAPNLRLTPDDIGDFCASTPTDYKQFWLMLISGMVEKESSHKPQTSYKENFKDRNGRYIVSRGLLQLSIESANGYGCGFKSEQELHDPIRNLECGLKILNKWVGKDKRIAGKVAGRWMGGSKYWSVLRTSKTADIMKWTRQACD